jgi:hypothetical protein
MFCKGLFSVTCRGSFKKTEAVGNLHIRRSNGDIHERGTVCKPDCKIWFARSPDPPEAVVGVACPTLSYDVGEGAPDSGQGKDNC